MAGLRKIATAGALALMLGAAGCQDGGLISLFPKAETPVPERLVKKMKDKKMAASSPIMVRIFKEESELEIWKEAGNGRYDLLETYEICKWSGKLGPKFKEGDRQAPEGFYTVAPWQMNPKSDYYLSFNIGFPNAYDRANERTGTHLMVHGACSSAGCYSMTDERMGEIYALARDAFKGGQTDFQIQAFPFRMTPENMAKHRDDPHFGFWQMLKEGSDHFEITRHPVKVDVCDKRYVFNRLVEDEKVKFKPTAVCPETTMPDSLALAYSEKVSKDEKAFEEVLKKIQIRERFAGKAKDAPVSTGAVAPVEAASAPAQTVAPMQSAAPAQPAAPVPQEPVAAAQDAAVPEPSPAAEAAATPPPEKKNFLQRLFSPKG